jgi:hypothetical protein
MAQQPDWQTNVSPQDWIEWPVARIPMVFFEKLQDKRRWRFFF